MKTKTVSSLLLVMLLCSVAGAASLPSITMLSTKTCPACEEMSKVLKDINAKYSGKISTAHIYLEDNPDIAKKYNVTIEQLVKWNNIQDPNILTVGQQLKVKF